MVKKEKPCKIMCIVTCQRIGSLAFQPAWSNLFPPLKASYHSTRAAVKDGGEQFFQKKGKNFPFPSCNMPGKPVQYRLGKLILSS
ncbi:MAG: hypothetical protein LUD83_10275 [Clostridiales bacterium]|nr:hypothetical protein [Clostridiales bacterium]